MTQPTATSRPDALRRPRRHGAIARGVRFRVTNAVLGAATVGTLFAGAALPVDVVHADAVGQEEAPTTTTSPTTTVAPTIDPPVTVPPTTPATTVPASPDTTTPTVPTAVPTATSPPTPAAKNVIAYPSQIANILATIRYIESRGNYGIAPNRGGASGAYQFIASTWNGFGGYAHAYLAPPEVQDERAALDVQRFLQQWNNDVSMVPVMWYYPRASRDVALMDIVPVPSAGNVLTVREYQQRWLGVWAFLAGQPIPKALTHDAIVARFGLPPVPPVPTMADPATPAEERTASVAFPVLGPTRLAAPDCGDATDVAQNAGGTASPAEIEAAGLCADQAPGIVFGVKMQPVLSVVDGTVTAVHNEPGTAISVTVTDQFGRNYRLDGFNDDNPGTDDGAAPDHLRLTSLAHVGSPVRAGQILGFMGDTDPLPLGIRSDVPTDATVDIPVDAVAPHIRLTIRDLDGTPVDAYGPVIDALFRQVCSIGTGPWSSPPTGAGFERVVTETTDDKREIDSEWVITETGQVTASGWAAMIYPSENCGFAPEDARGPGAGGARDIPPSWYVPIDLPTSIWVRLAVGPDDDLPAIPVRRP